MRMCVIVLAVYGGLMFLTYVGFQAVPGGFIPEQDKGYLIVNAQLPDGANLDRSDALVRKLSEVARETEGVSHSIDLVGYSTILNTKTPALASSPAQSTLRFAQCNCRSFTNGMYR